MGLPARLANSQVTATLLPSMNNDAVSLVIPGRNCAATIALCLEAVVPLLAKPPLCEIVFVDDGSTDTTAEIVAKFPVRYVSVNTKGPVAARNIGWRTAENALIWFVDADCVAEPEALDRLLPHVADREVGGVSGSYGIMNPQSLLACLIHEEIIERHRSMSQQVNFLATFNVVYRRAVLEEVGGFNERFLKGQDAELSFRVSAAGYTLRFEPESRVKHFHETALRPYLRTQRHQGYWRVPLHFIHRGHATGDSYSGFVDHVQPPLAMLLLLTAPLVVFGRLAYVPAAIAALLAIAQIPMAFRLVRRLGRARYCLFAVLSFVRAFWRGLGMTHGLCRWPFARSKLMER